MEAHKVGVSLALASNHAEILSRMSEHLLGVHAKVKDLETSFTRLGTAIGGALAVTAGMTVLSHMKTLVEKTKELNHEVTQITKMNVGQANMDAARAKAIEVTNRVKGITETQALAIYGSAYGMLGHENALKAMEPAARYAEAVGGTTGDYKRAHEDLYSMLRSGELTGAFTNKETHQIDVEQLNRFMDIGSKVIAGTHGRVDARQWLNMAQQGAPALSGLSDKGLVEMSILAQAMGGFRAGTAAMSMFQQFQGGMATQRTAKLMQEAGIISGFEKKGGGSVHIGAEHYTDPGMQEALRRSPRDFIGIIMKQLEAKGLNREEQAMKVFDIFGRQTTQRAAHDFIRNYEQIGAETGRVLGSMGMGAAKEYADTNDITQAMHNLESAWQNLLLAIAGPNSEVVVGILNRMTDALRMFTDYIRTIDPEVLSQIAVGITKIGAGLVVGGAVAITAALGPIGLLTAAIVALGVTLSGVDWPTEWAKFKADLAAISAWLDDVDRRFKQWQTDSVTALGDWVSGLEKTLEEKRDILVNKVSGWIQAFEGWIADLNAKWEEIKTAATTKMGEWVNKLIEEIKGIPGRVADAITEFGSKLMEGFREGAGRVTPGGVPWGQVNYSPGGGGGPDLSGMPGGRFVRGAGGGPVAEGINALGRDIARMPGFGRISAMNDAYHKGTGSKHAEGLAMDFTVRDGNYAAAAARARAMIAAAGVPEGAYRVIDEAAHPSARSTGPHVHVEFANRQAAEMYRNRGRGNRLPPAHDEPVKIHTAVNLSGKKFADNTTQHQGRMANGPSHGGQAFDGTRQHAGPDSAHLAA